MDPARLSAIHQDAVLLGWASLGAAAASLALRCGPRWLPVAFLPAALFLLAVVRLPVVLFNHCLYGDEAYCIAAAMGFHARGDFLPWRAVDPSTDGPLNIYALMWGVPFGVPLSYSVAHLTALACVLATVFFAFKALELVVGRRFAPLFLFPLVTFYVTARRIEFLHYSSEHLPLALLAAALFLLALVRLRPRRSSLLALGLLLGAVPMAKLQAAPLAAFLGIGALLVLGGRPSFGRNAAWLVGGALLVPAAILLPVFAAGAGRGFLVRDVFLGLHRGPADVFAPSDPALHYTAWQHLAWLLREGREGAFYVQGLAAAIAAALVLAAVRRTPFRRRSWVEGVGFLLLFSLLAAIAVAKPGTDYLHYLLLFLLPLLACAAWAARGAARSFPIVRRTAVLILLAAVATAPVAYHRLTHLGPRHLQGFIFQALLHAPPEDATAAWVRARARPGDRLAVWGSIPEYYPETGLPPAARDIVTTSDILPGPYRDDYRRDYLADLEAAPPAFLIDVVPISLGNNPTWPRPAEADAWPALGDFLRGRYDRVERPEFGAIRVYVRKTTP